MDEIHRGSHTRFFRIHIGVPSFICPYRSFGWSIARVSGYRPNAIWRLDFLFHDFTCPGDMPGARLRMEIVNSCLSRYADLFANLFFV